MKKLEIVINSENLEDLEKILTDCNASGAMISNIMGYSNQKGHKTIYRGSVSNTNLLPKLKVETIVPNDVAETIIEKVSKEISTSNYVDGKIFIYDAEDAVKIRTGERGKDAL